ncbi:MAG: multicopper oxidase domain-containing protein [Thermodesulfobacteriota bacterium]
MAIEDIIPRDQDFHTHDGATTFDPLTSPADLVMMQEFGVAVPTSEQLLTRNVADLPTPEEQAVTHRLNLLVPELTAGLIPTLDDLPTPDRVAPDRTFERQGLHDFDLPVYPVRTGGTGTFEFVEMWPFEDTAAGILTWPSAPIRCVEGEVCHTRMNNRGGPHTIHHHGIEPTAFNDGVGKLSVEVAGPDYVYQWQANEAGTYFYHCHRNTVLHFEMGMYGMLLVDPPAPVGSGLTAPYALGGPGFVRRRSELVRYDREAIWVPDDIDPRWRELANRSRQYGIADPAPLGDPTGFFYHSDWNGNLNGEFNPQTPLVNDGDPALPPGLHFFDPRYFVISGVSAPWTVPQAPGMPARPPTVPPDGVSVRATPGQTVLVRLLNASYTTMRFTFPLDAEVVAVDGHTLGHGDRAQYSQPFTVPAGESFVLTTARRWDILFHNVPAGTHTASMEFRNWTNDALFYTAQAQIIVA